MNTSGTGIHISRTEAGAALDAIVMAGEKVREQRGYREASPFLVLWGVLWFIANGVTALAAPFAPHVRMAVLVVGALVTAALVVKQSMRAQRDNAYTEAERKLIGRRVSMLGISVTAFFPAMFMVLGPMSAMQVNAFISLFWALAYMAAGAFLGLRLFLTGVATLLAVLLGVLVMPQHYFLWMAFAGGGSLVLGGLWLRKL